MGVSTTPGTVTLKFVEPAQTPKPSPLVCTVQIKSLPYVSLVNIMNKKSTYEKPLTARRVNVVKRQPDGTWKTIIDNPFHAHHIGLMEQ